MIKVWKCKICGDPYLGDEAPKQCPFCGAPGKYIIHAAEYVNPNPVKGLEEGDRKNLEEALKLEVSATQFYACCEGKAESGEDKAMFHALMKVEREHASLITKALAIPKAEIGTEPCNGPLENLKESLRREVHATEVYAKSAAEAKGPRVKEIFQALTRVESEHIDMLKPKVG